MIRPYTSTDKNSLIQLLRLNTPAYFAPSEEADFVIYLEERAEHYFVFEMDSQIVGCGGYNTGFNAGRTVLISWDIIHPNFQGKGIGKVLLQYRIDRIKENPAVNKIIVRTTQHVYQFYQKAGFELQRVETDYWADGFDLYFMSRAVSHGLRNHCRNTTGRSLFIMSGLCSIWARCLNKALSKVVSRADVA